jgi:hypothetical protein
VVGEEGGATEAAFGRATEAAKKRGVAEAVRKAKAVRIVTRTSV